MSPVPQNFIETYLYLCRATPPKNPPTPRSLREPRDPLAFPSPPTLGGVRERSAKYDMKDTTAVAREVPDSCSPHRFAAQGDGQIEHAWILNRSLGPDIPSKLGRQIIGALKSGERYQWPISDPPFLTRLEKLSPKMMLAARHIIEIMTYHSKSLPCVRNHNLSYCFYVLHVKLRKRCLLPFAAISGWSWV